MSGRSAHCARLPMKETFRRLILGIVLIAATSALLLISDLGSRVNSEEEAAGSGHRTAQVALLQHASQSILDQARAGMIAGLAEKGWVENENLKLRTYNAEGDMTVAQAIAREMVNGGNDLLLTISTPSLQAVANANKTIHTRHVFGIVTNPAVTGVGVSGTDPLDHPAWMAGYGTMQPVEQAFKIAREMYPDLKSVGVVWNASEANAEAQVKLARKVCAEMGITLQEATVENSAGVGEAAAAVVARGVDAIWIAGDVTVITAVDSVIAAAKKGRIPAFSVIPPNAKKGALFDIGADYYEVGRLTGLLGGDVLNGLDPKTVKVENMMPEMLAINQQAALDLKAKWTFPESMIKRARVLIDEKGVDRSPAPPASALPKPKAQDGKNYEIAIAYYSPEPSRDSCEHGLIDGLKELGFVEGKNLSIARMHAQGEIVNIPAIIQNFESSPADAIVTFSTPVLQGAMANTRTKPTVFTYVTDPIAAGAGESLTKHLPTVTGIGSLPPVADAIKTLRKVLPKVKSIGTLYNTGEANSLKVVSLLREACKEQGIELVEVPGATTGEMMQSVQALVSRDVDAIYLPADNTAVQALDGIVRVATNAGIPILNEDPDYLDRGVLLCVGPGFYHSGKAAAPLLARVLNGESPATVPMENVSVNVVKFNEKVAKALKLDVPDSVIKEITASSKPQKPASALNPSGKKWKIAIVVYNETPPAEEILAGMKDQWARSKLVEGKDYEISVRSAQGDTAALNGIIDAVLTSNADIIVPLSTPSLQVAVQKVKRTPVVFSLIANPIAAGAGKSYEDHLPNITGVAVLGPAGEMLDMIETHYPRYKRLGTLFCPSEANSVDLKDSLAKLCKERGYTLEAVAANSPAELADAAMALMTRPIDAVVQISDNLSSAGFTAITKAARQSQKPLISLNSTMVPLGAAVAMGRDYHYAGEVTVEMIEEVIAGKNPANMPFILPPKVMLTVSPANAKAVGMSIPEALTKKADAVK